MKSEMLTIRMDPKEMEELNELAVMETERTGSPVSVSELVRQKLSLSTVKLESEMVACDDWSALSGTKWEFETAKAREPITVYVDYLSIGLKMCAFDVEEMYTSKIRALRGDLDYLPDIRMRDAKEADDSFRNVVHKMSAVAGNALINHIDKIILREVLDNGVAERMECPGKSAFQETMDEAFGSVEGSDLVVAKIICGNNAFHAAVKHHPEFESACQRDILMSGLYGHLGSADVHMRASLGNQVLVLPYPEGVGKAKVTWHVEGFKDCYGYGWSPFCSVDFALSGKFGVIVNVAGRNTDQ